MYKFSKILSLVVAFAAITLSLAGQVGVQAFFAPGSKYADSTLYTCPQAVQCSLAGGANNKGDIFFISDIYSGTITRRAADGTTSLISLPSGAEFANYEIFSHTNLAQSYVLFYPNEESYPTATLARINDNNSLTNVAHLYYVPGVDNDLQTMLNAQGDKLYILGFGNQGHSDLALRVVNINDGTVSNYPQFPHGDWYARMILDSNGRAIISNLVGNPMDPNDPVRHQIFIIAPDGNSIYSMTLPGNNQNPTLIDTDNNGNTYFKLGNFMYQFTSNNVYNVIPLNFTHFNRTNGYFYTYTDSTRKTDGTLTISSLSGSTVTTVKTLTLSPLSHPQGYDNRRAGFLSDSLGNFYIDRIVINNANYSDFYRYLVKVDYNFKGNPCTGICRY